MSQLEHSWNYGTFTSLSTHNQYLICYGPALKEVTLLPKSSAKPHALPSWHLVHSVIQYPPTECDCRLLYRWQSGHVVGTERKGICVCSILHDRYVFEEKKRGQLWALIPRGHEYIGIHFSFVACNNIWLTVLFIQSRTCSTRQE